MKSKVRMFLAAALALIVLFGTTGCPQSQSGGETIMIDITVKGDANVNVPADPVQVTLGSQWSTVKAILTPKVTAKTGWLIDSWHPGEDASQPEIDNAKIFYGDETVFVKSRPILPELPKPAKPGDPSVKITFEVASEAGKILGDNPVIVRPNTTWADLKDYAKAALKTNYGFSEESVQWKQGSAPLSDGTSFTANATITAYPEDLRIFITVAGDSYVNVTDAEEKIIAIDGAKWKTIKETAAAKVTVSDSDRAVTEWKLNNAGGTTLTDGFEFKKADGQNRTVFAVTGDRRITLTVKYGTGSGTPTTGGIITIYDGDTWDSKKARAAEKVIIPQGHIIRKWRLNDASGQVLSGSYTFKVSDGNTQTVYAELQNQQITVTVKYGRAGKNPTQGGTITVYNGTAWSNVQTQFEEKIPSIFAVQEWRLNDAGGRIINGSYTFKADDGPARTVYALIRPYIYRYNSMGIQVLNYYSSNGTERSYKLCPISAVNNGTVGDSTQSDNKPHRINLTAYQIGETEIPQALYELVMGDNPSTFQGSSLPPAAGEKQALRPVEEVNWFDAVAFCNELTRCTSDLGEEQCVYTYNGHTYTVQDAKANRVPVMNMRKKGFRLPTEAEWEWAAQSGTNRQKYAGTNDESTLGTYAWYIDNSGNKTHEVKKKSPNAFGLYDMTGNVFEWCWDWHSATLADGTDPIGASSGSTRVIRGGYYENGSNMCLNSIRTNGSPHARYSYGGFRVVFRY